MRWVSTSVSVRILEDREEKKITSQQVFKVSNRFLFELKDFMWIMCVLLVLVYLNFGS